MGGLSGRKQARRLVVTVLGLFAAGCASAQTSVRPIPTGDAKWYCLTDHGMEHGHCLPHRGECEQLRLESVQGQYAPSECKPQDTAWCFLSPVDGGRAAYRTCSPTSGDCARARRIFRDTTDQPPHMCHEYEAPQNTAPH